MSFAFHCAHLLANLDVSHGLGDLAGDEDLATARGLVVEQDAVASVHVVRLPATAQGTILTVTCTGKTSAEDAVAHIDVVCVRTWQLR